MSLGDVYTPPPPHTPTQVLPCLFRPLYLPLQVLILDFNNGFNVGLDMTFVLSITVSKFSS